MKISGSYAGDDSNFPSRDFAFLCVVVCEYRDSRLL